jgi:uncharacterized membrane protein
MAAAGPALREIFLFGVFALLFLGPIHLYLSYRWHRATRTNQQHRYALQADPWLPAVVAVTGLVLIALLSVIR